MWIFRRRGRGMGKRKKKRGPRLTTMKTFSHRRWRCEMAEYTNTLTNHDHLQRRHSPISAGPHAQPQRSSPGSESGRGLIDARRRSSHSGGARRILGLGRPPGLASPLAGGASTSPPRYGKGSFPPWAIEWREPDPRLRVSGVFGVVLLVVVMSGRGCFPRGGRSIS